MTMVSPRANPVDSSTNNAEWHSVSQGELKEPDKVGRRNVDSNAPEHTHGWRCCVPSGETSLLHLRKKVPNLIFVSHHRAAQRSGVQR
jgi:hypothetical protein